MIAIRRRLGGALLCSWLLLSSACGGSGGGSVHIGDAGPEEEMDGSVEEDATSDTPEDSAQVQPEDAAAQDAPVEPMDVVVPQETGPADAASPDADADAAPANLPAWTVLVYMAADNNLEKYAIDDLNEMLNADLAGDINLLVQMDRASGFYELGVGGVANWTTMKRFRVTKNTLTEVGDLGEKDTGDPVVLSEFIKWGFTSYPSQHRLLVLWNHGNAWQGYGGDDDANHDLLDQNELQQAIDTGLTDAKIDKLDLIGFDACLMSTFVTAQAMVKHTRYYVASEEFEPGNGWDYTATLNYLSTNLAATPVELGTRIANDFYAQCRKEKKHADATINLIDLTPIEDLKKNFDELITALDQSLDDAKTRVAGARTKAATFGYHADPEHAYHMVDMGDLARRLASLDKDIEPARDHILATLAKMNVANKYGANKQDSSGLSIYFPTAQAFYKNGYDAVQEGAPWRELLKKFYALSNSSSASPPSFKGQSASGAQGSGRPRYEAPSIGSSLTQDPVNAATKCEASEGPQVSSPLNQSDISKVASSTLVSGLVDSRTGEVHVFSREPAEMDPATGNVKGTWDRHVLVANQGAQQALLFAEVKLSPDQRFAFASVPMLYSEPPACRCATPGTPGYSDIDADGRADCADGDVDGDGIADKGPDAHDNCVYVPNPTQADADQDGTGDACESGTGAPSLGCVPQPSGEFAKLESAFWQITVDRLNGEKYAAALYVSTAAGASEIAPLPGGLLWPRSLVLKGDGSLVFETGQPLPFNLQQPIEFNYLDVEEIFVLNEAGDTLRDAQLKPTKLMNKLGWNDVFMRVFVSDFAGRGGAAEVQADFSNCDPPKPEFCVDPKVPDCDGRCLDPEQLLANGTCDDGTAGKPNLNCELRNFDDGECKRPDCPAGYIRDCEGKCTLKAGVLGDGQCDALAQCESLQWDHNDCPCGPDCSGHGSCGVSGCTCETGYTGNHCQTPPSCGDGSCNLADAETCSTCPSDCGACVNPCGDGTCNANQGETCDTCTADCGVCACGDGQCVGDEDCTSCAKDCGACPTCGDFTCASYSAAAHFTQGQAETCASCALDCGACAGDCCVASQGTSDKFVGGGCGDQTVSQCVCTAKPECCINGWSADCVAYAKSNCNLTCVLCPPVLGGDADGDTRCGLSDNCPLVANTDQADTDQDGAGDACDMCSRGNDKLDPDQDLKPSACDNCPGISNASQSDQDSDTVGDACDNCLVAANSDQADGDGDRVGNLCDNCLTLSNPDQRDTDRDGLGDACDPCNDAVVTPDTDHDGVQDSCDADDDADAIPDTNDNCPLVANAGQADLDQDGQGDACDSDDDNDTVPDASDNCLLVPNQNQLDLDADSLGDACDSDRDGDNVANGSDNCPDAANATQSDLDGDAAGDACDSDDDNDTVPDAADNCPNVANTNQADLDGDGAGDACDTDRDGDGVPDASDNCPLVANANQSDIDGDSLGDACDSDRDGDGVADGSDNCPLVPNANQSDIDADGLGDVCDGDRDGDGVPDVSDNCPLAANADQADLDLDTVGDVCDGDRDGDSVPAGQDSDDGNRFVCRDLDADGCDDCVSGSPQPNADGADQDGDGLCDVGDADRDGDGVPNVSDNCPLVSNAGQQNADGDSQGDACDADMDNDSVPNAGDNCPLIANNDQANFDADSLGDVCDPDDDNDGTADAQDQCPFDPARISAGQCGCLGVDTDTDGDGVADCIDACPNSPLSTTKPCQCPVGQQDNDNDGLCQPDCQTAPLSGCYGHGMCDDQSGVALCVCDPGYTGALCNACAVGFQDNDLNGSCEPTCATAALNCGAGTCVDTSGTPKCICPQGLGGADCSTIISYTQMKGGPNSTELPYGGMVVDGAGNSYVFISFGGGPTDYGTGPITSYGGGDSVLVSYDPTGNVRWVRQIGGDQREDTGHIAIDAQGNLFLVGTSYSNVINVGPSQTIPGAGAYHAYVMSYDSAGNFRWGKVLGVGEGYSIATDAAGNVFAGGWVASGGFDYGTGAGVQQARGAGDMFLVSYTNDGATTRWANVYGTDQITYGPPVNGVRGLTTDAQGNVYAAMIISGPNGNVGGPLLAYGGTNSTAVVASYTNAGAYRWSSAYAPSGGGVNSDARAIATDGLGHVAVGISFTDTIDFGGGPVSTSAPNNSASSLVWLDSATGAYGGQQDFLTGVPFAILDAKFDINGNVYICGNQNNGGGNYGAGSTPSGAFVASYDVDHMYRFAQVAGGGAYPTAYGLWVLPTGDLMLVGNTQTSIDWGTGVVNTSGQQDTWLTRMNMIPVRDGLIARYTAQQSTTLVRDGANAVSTWWDVAGQASELQLLGANPHYSPNAINGRPGVDFSGGAGLFSSAPFDLNSEITVFAVMKQGTPAGWGAVVHHGSRDDDWSIEQNAFSAPDIMHFQSANDNAGADLPFQTGNSYLVVGRIVANSREFQQFSNASPPLATSAQGVTISPRPATLYVGHSDVGEASNATIGEILYFNRALSDPERDAVIDYLRLEWGI